LTTDGTVAVAKLFQLTDIAPCMDEKWLRIKPA